MGVNPENLALTGPKGAAPSPVKQQVSGHPGTGFVWGREEETGLFSGAFVSETTMFWSMKMRRASRKPRPMALRMLRADRRSNGATLKMGRSCTLKTGTVGTDTQV